MQRPLRMKAPARAGAPLAAAVALALHAGTAAAAVECEALADLALPETTITSAERVPAGPFVPPAQGGEEGGAEPLDVPSFCRVAGVVAPAIGFEVWLPEAEAWTGRFQGLGGGGLAGTIGHAALAGALARGDAAAATDTGHKAPDLEWLGDRGRVADFGYRAIHEMTVKAKAVIEAYYGEPARRAYFSGCSTGGRQGLMEAQRYPEDYDGIVAGAPVHDYTSLLASQVWTALSMQRSAGARLTPEDLATVTEAVLAQCDAGDGVEDGFLGNPRACDFDPAALQCAAGESGACLSATKVETLRRIYGGLRHPSTGEQIYPGLEVGSEGPQPNNPGWSMTMGGDEPFGLSYEPIRRAYLENLDYDWRSFDFDRDVEFMQAKLGPVLDAMDPDLRDFAARGGKIILYHGWNDPGVAPQSSIDYYENVTEFTKRWHAGDAAAETGSYLRLFMMPGMGHCRGGAGPDQADFVSAIAGWVEEGRAPERVIASKVERGEVRMTRPLCPYPQRAAYSGSGDNRAAENFECAAP